MANRSPDRLTARPRMTGVPRIVLEFLAALFWLAWQATRLSILAVLVMFEPIVDFALTALAVLIALSAIPWSLTHPRPDSPFWTIVAASLACVLLLVLYHALIRVLSGIALKI